MIYIIMSVSNLLTPNNFELFTKKITTDITNTSSLKLPENTIDPPLFIYNSTSNLFLNSTISLKFYSSTPCYIFNDTQTISTTILGTQTPMIKLRSISSDNINGFPNIKGNVNSTYSSLIFLSISGTKTECIINFIKVSSTEINININKLDGLDFLATDTISILPFSTSYISS